MKHWVLFATIIICGLFIAKATYNAGLRQFAYAIGGTGTAGWLLVGFNRFYSGGALLLANFVLVLVSRHRMKKYQIGPFS